jgi:hypothetical protein
MKLFVLISGSMAQEPFGSFAAPDLSSFGLPSFGGDLFSSFNAPSFNAAPVEVPAAPAAVVAEDTFDGVDGDDGRYFSRTTSPTTTTSPITSPTTQSDGYVCWHCDADSFANCALHGEYRTCSLGEKDCCFVELRETKDKLQQICTGCKAYQACHDLKRQNFVWSDSKGITTHEMPHDQCRPVHNRLQSVGRFRGQQSVCRTCFRQCKLEADNTDGKGSMCFGGLQENGGDFSLTFPPTPPAMAGTWEMNGTPVLGIPTWGAFDKTADTDIIACIEAGAPLCLPASLAAPQLTYTNYNHVYFGKSSAANGKTYDVTYQDGDRSVFTEMTFWQIQDQPKPWWQTDLKREQDTYYSEFPYTP